MLQLGLLGPIVGLIEGPVFSIIDKLIPDPSLKAKLKAEIQAKTIAHQNKVADSQRQILMQELGHGSLMTRSWRPVLMYLIILFLMVYGLLLPIVELFTLKPVVFNPRWQEIPDGLWNLLGLGVGGYIGGRSLEKIAVSMAEKRQPKAKANQSGWRRHNNLTSS